MWFSFGIPDLLQGSGPEVSTETAQCLGRVEPSREFARSKAQEEETTEPRDPHLAGSESIHWKYFHIFQHSTVDPNHHVSTKMRRTMTNLSVREITIMIMFPHVSTKMSRSSVMNCCRPWWRRPTTAWWTSPWTCTALEPSRSAAQSVSAKLEPSAERNGDPVGWWPRTMGIILVNRD